MSPPKWWTSTIKSCNPSRGKQLGAEPVIHSLQKMKGLQNSRLNRSPLTFTLMLLLLVVAIPPAPAGTTDGESALSRLQAKAEDAMAQGDPQGAANSIGRAALLASQLDKQSDATRPPYRIMVDLFRAQEQVYRAIALFQQSGERTPASSGICSLLSQGRQHAFRALEQNSVTTAGTDFHELFHEESTEWMEIIQELQQDWACM